MNVLFASLFLVTLSQVANAQTIRDLAIEYEPQIGERQKNLRLNIEQISSQIGQTQGALRMSMSIAASSATKDMVQLRNSVNIEAAQARAENRNIGACIVAVNTRLSQLNFGEIYACRDPTQMQLAQQKWSQLDWAQRDLSKVLPTCLSQSDTTQARSCIDGDLARIDNQITSTITEFKSLIDAASSVDKECVDTRRNEIQNQISVAGNDFRTCTGTK